MTYKLVAIILFTMLLGIAPLCAQPQLTGILTVDTVQGYIIQMHLDVTNTGDETFSYSFPDSETHFFSIDGLEYHDMVIPVILPWSLEPGETDTFGMINFNPLTSGPHVIQTFLNISPPTALGEPVTVVIDATIPVTIGSGDELSRVPIDFYWRTTLYECIYTAEELDHTSGWISAISLYNNFSQVALPSQDIRIYLARVTQSDLSEDWLGWDDLVTVFYGTVDFPLGTNEIIIPLDSGIYVDGISNLGLVVHRPIPSYYGAWAEPFQAQAADSLRSRKIVSDSQTLHPYNPPDPLPSQHIGFMPKITFHIIPNTTENDEDINTPIAISASLYPNPVRSDCSISIKSDTPQSASIDIFNLRGQKIRSLNSPAKSTDHLLYWDSKDRSGMPCPQGIYIYRINSGHDTLSKRLVLLRL